MSTFGSNALLPSQSLLDLVSPLGLKTLAAIESR
jgi:hypothetical protein